MEEIIIKRKSNIRTKIIVAILSTVIFLFTTFIFTLIPNHDFFSITSILARAVIVFVLLRGSMLIPFTKTKGYDISESDKLIVSFIGTIIYLILTTKILFELTNVIGSRIGIPTLSAQEKSPTLPGIILHAIIYGLIVFVFMR